MMGAFFAAFGVLFAVSPSGLTGGKFAVFLLMSFSQQWGCNLATYVLPAQLFPFEVRTTFHGLSAASGKLGAVIGTLIFPLVLESFGIAAVMWLQVAVCVTGALVTQFCLPDSSPAALLEMRAKRAGEAGSDGDEGGDDDSGRSLLANA